MKKVDGRGALAVLISALNYCKDRGYLQDSEFSETNFHSLVNILADELALLDDFKTWYSLDDIVKARGKRTLSYLRDYIEASKNEDRS